MLLLPLQFALLLTYCWGHPLDDYVNTPDPAYGYEEVAVYEQEETTLYVLNMTSQTWMTADFSNISTWFHYVSVIVPNEVAIPDQTYLFISVGHNWHDPPSPDNDPLIPILSDMAATLGCTMAMINQVPNQPCVFAEDASQRVRIEDDIIAWTWGRYMNMSEPADEEQLLYFPMTKAVVRGMDTVAEVAQNHDPVFDIDKFIVGGPSKRGWTTYLTAAVDPRVVAMTPQVLSCLNLIPNLHQHYQSLGGWSWAFEPYWREGLTERLDSPEAELLAYMQDPYTFMERYTMPSLLIKAGNDEFFMLDDFQFFIDEFPGVHYPMNLENTNHYMIGQWLRLQDNIEAFFLHVYYGYEWPEFNYTMESGADSAFIEVEVLNDAEVVNITGWVSETLEGVGRRDWRSLALNEEKNDTEVNFPRFSETEVDDLGNGKYRLEVDAPEEGWAGFFITVYFQAPNDRVLEFSSETLVVPNEYPFEDCEGSECKGELV